jgi:hypothetical protein
MRLLASILLFGFIWLHVQPIDMAYMPIAQHTSDCCSDTSDANKGCEAEGNGCCGSGGCNPIASHCPVCAGVALPVGRFTIDRGSVTDHAGQHFGVVELTLVSYYLTDILHPPEVC